MEESNFDGLCGLQQIVVSCAVLCDSVHVCTVHQQYQDTILLLQTDANNYKIIEILEQNSDYRSDMFRFTQEPSSGSCLVLS